MPRVGGPAEGKGQFFYVAYQLNEPDLTRPPVTFWSHRFQESAMDELLHDWVRRGLTCAWRTCRNNDPIVQHRHVGGQGKDFGDLMPDDHRGKA